MDFVLNKVLLLRLVLYLRHDYLRQGRVLGSAILVLWCGTTPQVCSAEATIDFVADIAPLLEKHCLRCHSEQRAKGAFSLATGRGLFESGHVVSGEPGQSYLLEVVRSVNGDAPQMPKDGTPLTIPEQARLRRWIAEGANWPEKVTLPRFWAAAPVRSTAVPNVTDNRNWGRSPLDAFIYRKLVLSGLQPSRVAELRDVIRRVSFGLLGLPPAREEIERFIEDCRPDSLGRLIDRTLASPHYGERWAQHWLDVVRFSESDGFEEDQPRDHAWPYRDYVIRSFNNDKPYDQFVREQIAGDVLEPVTVESIVATGFLVAGPFDHAAAVTESDVERRRSREVQMAEMVGTTSQAFLALTVNCARCHDHKFDPIPQADYYRMKSVFDGVDQSEGNPRIAHAILTPSSRKEFNQRKSELEENVRLARRTARLLKIEARSLEDEIHPPPLNRATALWQFAGRNSDPTTREDLDLKGGESGIVVHGTASFTQPASAGIRAQNTDGWVLSTGQGATQSRGPDGIGFAIRETFIPSIPADADLLPLQRTALTIFARVRFNDRFNRIDDVFRVGNSSDENRDSYGFELVAAGDDQVTSQPRFVVCGNGHERETGLDATTLMETGRWYDLAGVFEPLPVVGEVAKGRMTLYVADPSTGKFLGTPQTRLVPFDTLTLEPRQNLLFFVAPSYRNGRNAGAEMDLAAVWHVALTPEEILNLSSIDDSPLILPTAETTKARAATVTRIKASLSEANQKLVAREAEITELEAGVVKSYVGVRREPAPTVIYERGNVATPGQIVTPAGLSVIAEPPANLGLHQGFRESDRRIRFAQWLTDDRHPLTSRVMVNRVWQHHFGVGIVDSPSDFGMNGGRPSHPELLDWLSVQFVASDWSLKGLHRRMLSSATWLQSATFNPKAATLDRDNRLLWRFTPRRLDAEAVRDAMLTMSNDLNRKLEGASFRPFEITRFNTFFYKLFDRDEPQYNRRTIYRMKINTGRDPFLDAFDCPAPSVMTPSRRRTVTPLQALALMNDTFVQRQAEKLASRIQANATDLSAQIELLWQETLGRAPDETDVVMAENLVQDADFATLCWMLFNSSEFLTLQ